MSTVDDKAFLVFSGGNDRAVLAFLRALHVCGERANIVARTPGDRILLTRCRRDVKWVRDSHVLSLDIFAECVRRVRASAAARTLVVLPSTEYFNTFLLQHRPHIEAMGCEIPLVESSLYAQLTGKRTGTDFFSATGIAVPRELTSTALGAGPVVAKPLFNIAPSGESLYPQLLDTTAQISLFHRTHDPMQYFFQEWVHGDSLYLLFHLDRSGQHEFTWSHRNLLQQPGGKSMILAEPSDFHRSDTAKRILHALRDAKFYGLGMVEVIRTTDRDVFIEMNPRIWGPAQFCLDQRQPILQAFIGEALYRDPLRYVRRAPRRRRPRYFWFGGLLETMSAGKRPTWHAAHRTLASIVRANIASDVYMRVDSWRCFARDLASTIRVKPSRERTRN